MWMRGRRAHVDSLREDLDEVKANIGTTNEASTMDSVLARLANLESQQDAKKELSESLERAMTNQDHQLREVQQQTQHLKEQVRDLAALTQTKAEMDVVTSLSGSLVVCNRELVEFRDDQLPKLMAHKVDVETSDKQRQRVEILEEQTAQLMEMTAQLMQLIGAVGHKAEPSAVEDQHDQLESFTDTFRQQLADMESNFRMDLEKVAAMADGKTGTDASLTQLVARLEDLEERQCADKEVTVQLAEQSAEANRSIVQQAQRCTRLEDGFQKLQLLDQRFMAIANEFDKNAEHVKSQLAHKLDISDLNSTDQETVILHRKKTDVGARTFMGRGSSRVATLPGPDSLPARSSKRAMTDPSRAEADLPPLSCPAVTPRTSTTLPEAPISNSNHRSRSCTGPGGSKP
mmetsp:Transcript_107335/g.207971  ORF Transcript_107335/g.207971 Transcript_107335/m.207971 type:complete len:403 (+) Transcript_107335:52-1260(+)